jgi:hypothetical protein
MVFAISGFNSCSRKPGIYPNNLKESVFDRFGTAARMLQDMQCASLSHSRFFPLSGFENCAMRIENAVSKYFLEYIEIFSPRIFFTFAMWGAKKIYWGLRKCELVCWLRDFKKLVSAKKMSLYEGKPQFDAEQFTTSSQFHRLTTLFPIIHLWKAKKIDWIDLSGGTCFGESLSALKYQRYFTMRRGFLGFPAEEKICVKNEVIFIQTIHQIQSVFLSVLKCKRKMESKQIYANDLMTRDNKIDEARLFHFLRPCMTSRMEARYYCNRFAESFAQSSTDLIRAIASCDQALKEAVDSSHLSEIFLNEKGYKKHTQKELDSSVCDFLARRSGCFVLICGGGEKIGHALFIKIEDGQCLTFDPGTNIHFITPHTPEGVFKTVELMKKLLISPNLGSNLYYKVMSIDS